MPDARRQRELPPRAVGFPSEASELEASTGRAAAARRELAVIEQVAYWMDRRYLDPILGLLLPGVGDAMGAVLGLLTVVSAFRLRAHPIVIARMLINLAFDAVLGAIPLLGAVIDFFYQAHIRNLKLIQEREARASRASDWLVVGGAALVFLLALCVPIAVVIALVSWLW